MPDTYRYNWQKRKQEMNSTLNKNAPCYPEHNVKDGTNIHIEKFNIRNDD